MILYPGVDVALYIIVGLSLLLVTYRTVRGPSAVDRILGVDMLAYLAIGAIATTMLTTGLEVFVDVAVVIALTAFVATVAFATYGLDRPKDPE